MAKRGQKTMKLLISGMRRGEMRFNTEYTPREAARSATKMARAGFDVQVKLPSGHVKMTCAPKGGYTKGSAASGKRGIASCQIKPAFKKLIKGA